MGIGWGCICKRAAVWPAIWFAPAVLYYHHLAGVAIVRIARSEHAKVGSPLAAEAAAAAFWAALAEHISAIMREGQPQHLLPSLSGHYHCSNELSSPIIISCSSRKSIAAIAAIAIR
jgi:hypothetical protein